MASVYDISLGTDRILINETKSTFLAVQLSAASLDADVTVKLQHSSDGTNFFDLPNTSYTLASASDSQLVETFDFTLDKCYLYVDVGSATTGTIDVFTSLKKKEDNEDVNATISGTVDANVTNASLDVNVINDSLSVDEITIDSNSEGINLLRNILKEIRLNNKLLRKILN